MTALDDRIRALAPPAEQQPTPVEELRRRGARRRARHRVVAGVATVAVVAVVVALAVVRPSGHDPDTVVAEPPPEEVEPRSEQIVFGGAEGVTLTVSPATGLVEGQSVEVRVEGLENLVGAQLAMCRGDLEEPVGLEDCDLGALGQVAPVTSEQTVVVSASLSLVGVDGLYECATEPAGCLLALGTTGPTVKGVAVPLGFVPGSGPTPNQEQVSVSPASGLQDGQAVDVTASGLRPLHSYQVAQCAVRVDAEPAGCESELSTMSSPVVADTSGNLSTLLRVTTVVWSMSDGVVDCTVAECRVQLLADGNPVVTSAPIGFAPGVVAPMPRLEVVPAGPYDDRQEVVVRGSGFVPGSEYGSRVAQCPAGLDTRIEERCSYGDVFSGLVVGPDGTFETWLVLQESLMFTGSCREEPGCMVAWVINHGPTVAEVPLTFR